MGHSVGKAADQAVKRSEKKKPSERSPEQILKDLRNNLGARIAVTPDDQRFLLAAYDAEKEFSKKLADEMVNLKQMNESQAATIKNLQERIDEFRSVYEQENSRTTVTVERMAADAAVDFGILPTDREAAVDCGILPPDVVSEYIADPEP